MKKTLSLVLCFALVLSMCLSFGVTKVDADKGNNSLKEGIIDASRILREEARKPENEKLLQDLQNRLADFDSSQETAAKAQAASNDEYFTFNGPTKSFYTYGYNFKPFTLRSIGDKVEVWVANDLSYGYEGVEPDIVTQAQVDRLAEEFDNSIYAKDTEFFGTPDSHMGYGSYTPARYLPEGYEVKERVIILVDNIDDESYYGNSRFRVVGFYSGNFEEIFDRNIITIDSQEWDQLMPNGDPNQTEEDASFMLATIAHEFQHLIHDDNDWDEETWINDGMSDFAEYLCGYGHPWGHIEDFLQWPENSLVYWGDFDRSEITSDYGVAYLMQLYLNDQFGKEFIKDLAVDEANGITGMNNTLAEFNTGIDFQELYRRFVVALTIDDPKLEDGIYSFSNLDIRVDFDLAEASRKDGVPAWGADFIQIDHANKIANMTMDGIEFLPIPWVIADDPLVEGGKAFWGNQGDEKSNFMVFGADLSSVESAKLKFDNYIQIEENWDFGMVQVSTDEGETWTSLVNQNTRTDVVEKGYPAIIANVPGFTGYYEDWTPEEFDLTPYAGQKILVGFRYMTDWATSEAGWYVKNIEIPEIGLHFAGDSMDGMMSLNESRTEYTKYQIAFINEKSLGKGKNSPNFRILNIDPYDISEEQVITLRDFFSGGKNYMVIWYAAGEGDKDQVYYSYEITTKNEAAKKK